MADTIETHEDCCKLPTTACPCPVCGNAGRKVSTVTLENHLRAPLREKMGNDVTFCLNPACEVVYCNPAGDVAKKGETVLPVTLKDPGDEVHVCYCFDFKRGDLRRDLREKGKTDIPQEIRKGIDEGRCDCERKNPQGACCLGNVTKAVRSIQEDLKTRS